MDDFLYNLRNGNTKRYEGKRKLYNTYNKGYDRQRPRDNRGNYKQNHLQQELIPTFKKMMEEISQNYKLMAAANERRAIAQERQVEILAGIADHLGISIPQKTEPVEEKTDSFPIPESEEIKSTASSQDSSPDTPVEFDKNKIVEKILEMRKNNYSYGKIAKYLRSKGIPTFSGRGTWHGQTVSRLIN
jgi:hypothetical protein